jgi:hypothetical protein
MGSRIARAVLHCWLGQWKLIILRAGKVKENLYVNTGLYPAPKIPEHDFTEQLRLASEAETAASGGGVDETAAFYKETTLLFNMMRVLIFYVNGLYRGNKVNLLASGFDVLDESVPLCIPSVPLIHRVVPGQEPHSAKFYLTKTPGIPGKKKPSVTYIVEMTSDPSKEENFKRKFETTNQFLLLITGLTRGQEVFFRLAARNSRGQSDWTEIIPFIPI